jgi:murein DD-endopeptidase MepM/ murein hydrolase activator NlpD
LQTAATQRAQAAKPSPAIGTPTDEPERGAPLPLDQQHVTQNIIPPQPQAPATAQQQVAPAPQLPSPPAAQQGPPKIQDEADRVILDPKLQHLRMPLDGVDPSDLADTFKDTRDHDREHEALDIPAARGTPVRAVAEGNVAKLFNSKQGGITVYQFNNDQTLCYYYAHLDHYATGLREGTLLRPGDVLGYVGTTGNAPPNAPHLHFAVFQLGPDKKWWQGKAIDPLPLLK